MPDPQILWSGGGFLLLAIAIAALWLSLRGRTTVGALGEASMNFDTDGLADYVQRLPSLIGGGFGEAQLGRLMAEVREMEHNEERTFDFPITWQGEPTTLLVEVFMDDIGAPDVAFIALPELATRIQADMLAWAEEKGL
jgi:hypothetical protein